MRRTIAAAAALIAAVAATVTAVALTPGGTPASQHPAAVPASTAPPACARQYQAWKHGTAATALWEFTRQLSAVRAAGAADDFPSLRAALIAVGKAAGRLSAYPVPRCADPAGDYARLLARVQAAGDNAQSAGIAGLILAEVPLKAVPGIERKLNAELNRTVGPGH